MILVDINVGASDRRAGRMNDIYAISNDVVCQFVAYFYLAVANTLQLLLVGIKLAHSTVSEESSIILNEYEVRSLL